MYTLKRLYDWLTMDYSWYYELYKIHNGLNESEIRVLRKYKNKLHLIQSVPKLYLESIRRKVTLREVVSYINNLQYEDKTSKYRNQITDHLSLSTRY